MAVEKNFAGAAAFYKKAGMEQRALDLFSDLRMFDEAQELMANASGDTQKTLMRKRATWAENSNEPRTAVNMYLSAGDTERAVQLMIEHDFMDLYVCAQ